MSLRVREALTSDFEAYHAHLERHGAESGQDGDLVFTPFEGRNPKSIEDLQHDRTAQWLLAITQVGWRRSWFLTNDQKILGEIQLVHMPEAPSCLHRAMLMIGIERSQRGKGWGTALTKTAVDWARAQPTLEWVQLNVFAHNQPAIALYEKAGFTRNGMTPDAFRVYGQSLDDIAMSLRL